MRTARDLLPFDTNVVLQGNGDRVIPRGHRRTKIRELMTETDKGLDVFIRLLEMGKDRFKDRLGRGFLGFQQIKQFVRGMFEEVHSITLGTLNEPWWRFWDILMALS